MAAGERKPGQKKESNHAKNCVWSTHERATRQRDGWGGDWSTCRLTISPYVSTVLAYSEFDC